MLSSVTRRTGIPARVAEDVRGNVSVGGNGGTLAMLLDDTAAQTDAIWWYDGVMLHFEPARSLTTVLLDARGMNVTHIRRELAALDLDDARFPLRSSADGAILRVSGPQGYVDRVAQLIGTLADMRRNRSAGNGEIGLYVPRVYYGRYTQ